MMKRKSGSLAAILALGFLMLATLGAVAQDARAIMERMDANARAQNNSVFSIMQIATCKRVSQHRRWWPGYQGHRLYPGTGVRAWDRHAQLYL